jgi:hypothetical protein
MVVWGSAQLKKRQMSVESQKILQFQPMDKSWQLFELRPDLMLAIYPFDETKIQLISLSSKQVLFSTSLSINWGCWLKWMMHESDTEVFVFGEVSFCPFEEK